MFSAVFPFLMLIPSYDVLLLLLWHCWLDDRKGIWSANTYPQWFCFGWLGPAWSDSANEEWLNKMWKWCYLYVYGGLVSHLYSFWVHIRPYRSTMYVDVAYCYRPSSMVCDSSEPCKNGLTDRNAISVDDSDGPKEPCIRCGSRSAMGGGNSEGVAAHCKV